MFFLATILGNVQLPKDMSIHSWNDKSIISALKEKYESMIIENQSIIILIIGNVEPTGTAITENAIKSHTIKFDALIFYPKLLEITLGNIVSIIDFGVLVRIGPIDAYVHLSQLFDGNARVELKSQIIKANDDQIVKPGDILRGRITSVSIPNTGEIRIGMTCRQPYLGKVK